MKIIAIWVVLFALNFAAWMALGHWIGAFASGFALSSLMTAVADWWAE